MDTVTKLKLKSAFLRAALHLQMAPMLFIPSFLTLKEQYLTTRNGFIKSVGTETGFEALFSSPVPKDHPIRDLIAPLAEKANLDIVDIIAQDHGCYAGIFNQGRFVKLFVSHRLLDDAIKNPSLVSGVIGHELTHAVRRSSSDIFIAGNSRIFALVAGCCYLPLFQSAPAMVMGAAALFSAACGIPAVARAFARNEEHMADIGSVMLTGDSKSLIEDFKVHLRNDKSYIQVLKSDLFEGLFGLTHPSFAARIEVLRSVFNTRSVDIPEPANDTEPAPLQHQHESGPDRKQTLG